MKDIDFLILQTTIEADDFKRKAFEELNAIAKEIETNKDKLLHDAQWIQYPLERFLVAKEQYNIAQAKLGIYTNIKENEQ